MTNTTFQQLQQRIDGLKLSVDKAEIIAELKNRLDSIRATQRNTNNPTTQEEHERHPLEVKNDTAALDTFEKNVFEKFGLLEAQIKTMRPTVLTAQPSITYENVTNTRVRNQLLADNIRMEHALLDLQLFPDFGEELAFRRFCAFAFFQIEELLNFHYHKKFRGDVKEIVAHFRKIKVKLPDNPQSLSSISTGSKIFAYNQDFSGSYNELNPIRLVRNKEQHRCTVLIKDWEFSVLEKKHEGLRLSEKRRAARELGGSYILTSEEREMDDDYNAIRFIRQKNHELVREVLNKIYTQVTK